MFRTTLKYLKSTTFTVPIPKSRDARHGYWNVKYNVTDVNDTEITFSFTCDDWLKSTFTLPIPRRLDTLYECVYLSISEMIVQQRIEYLCSIE